jgi:hydroxyethylthiazole kinase-like uncharacterized protein yjeF
VCDAGGVSSHHHSDPAPLPPAMTVAQVRSAEALTMVHTPESVLMDRAAEGLAEACATRLEHSRGKIVGSRIAVLVGTGNNGGDALLAGARLARLGAIVTAIGVGHTVHERALKTARSDGVLWCEATRTAGLATAFAAVADSDLVIDGITGIGSKPGLRAPASAIVAAITPSAVVVAVDVPSGLDADSGDLPATFVTADLTVTFTAPKPCLVEPDACTKVGEVVVVDVGVLRNP